MGKRTTLEQLKRETERLNETVQGLSGRRSDALRARSQAAVVGQLAGEVAAGEQHD